MLAQTYRFKDRRSDAAVSTSAVADNALKEGHRRRLLRWAAENVPFRSKVPNSGLQSFVAGLSQPAQEYGVKSGQGSFTALLDTAFWRPSAEGVSQSQSTAVSLQRKFTALGTKLRRFWWSLHDDSSHWRNPPTKRAQKPSFHSMQLSHAASLTSLTTAVQTPQAELVHSPHSLYFGHRQTQLSDDGKSVKRESLSTSLETPVSPPGKSSRSTDSTKEKQFEYFGSARDDAAPLRRKVLEERSGPTLVKLIGRPDWQACQALVNRVVTSAEGCEEEPCALGAHQPVRKCCVLLFRFYV